MAINTPVIDEMKQGGSWNHDWDDATRLDAEWMEDYLKAGAAAWRSGIIDPKTLEFIAIAVNASCTHMYAPGVRRHIRAALRLGATEQEILTVLQAVTAVSMHSLALGVPILVEEVEAQAQAQTQTPNE